MKIDIAAPSTPHTQTGNRTTATRWEAILAGLGHDVHLVKDRPREGAHLLIALHAIKSLEQIDAFTRGGVDRPIVIALSGTDIYGGLTDDPEAMRRLERGWRIVALQPLARNELPASLHDRTRVIHQSVQMPPACAPSRRTDAFEVCVVANLREVKDPLLTARAARLLPEASGVRITHLGAALSPELEQQALDEAQRNNRYTWAGPASWEHAMRVVARSKLMVVSSKHEGGANVIGEASAIGTPLLATRIPGNVGLLGDEYPGYFEAGNAAELASLLSRAESDRTFRDELTRATVAQRVLFTPQREREAWRDLLAELPTGA